MNGNEPVDVEGMLNAVTTNPDTTQFAAPPDAMLGASTITVQKIARQLSFAGWGDPNKSYDVWITQWDVEHTQPGKCIGAYVTSTGVPDASTGDVFYAGRLQAPPQTFADAGYAPAIDVGGLTVYFMLPGQSPFPAADGSGPYPPVHVEQLVFGEDVFHDLTRVIGSNYEVIDTTNSLSQQGACFQGAWEANQQDNAPWHIDSAVPGTSKFNWCPINGRTASCPPGTTDILVKSSENRTGAAKEGTFVFNRIDYSDNRPSSGLSGVSSVYESIDNHPQTAGKVMYLLTTPMPVLQVDTSSKESTFVTNPSQECRVFATNCQMSTTVLTGLNPLWSATISREIVTQSFTKPTSKYIAFAKKNQTYSDQRVMDMLEDVVRLLPMFHPSASNKTGRFAKLAKKLWNRVSPIVKPVAGMAASHFLGYDPAATDTLFKDTSDIVKKLREAELAKQGSKMVVRALPSEYVPLAEAVTKAAADAQSKKKAKRKNKKNK